MSLSSNVTHSFNKSLLSTSMAPSILHDGCNRNETDVWTPAYGVVAVQWGRKQQASVCTPVVKWREKQIAHSNREQCSGEGCASPSKKTLWKCDM
jgi:hypothetical protein